MQTHALHGSVTRRRAFKLAFNGDAESLLSILLDVAFVQMNTIGRPWARACALHPRHHVPSFPLVPSCSKEDTLKFPLSVATGKQCDAFLPAFLFA